MAGWQGIEAAVEHPDASVFVDVNPDDLSPAASVHGLGNGRPALHQAIRIGKIGRFDDSGLLSQRWSSRHGEGNRTAYENQPRSNYA